MPRAPMRCDIVTYNVLASPVFTPLRMKAVSSLLETSDADVIALQEVSAEILSELMAQPWIGRYHATTRTGVAFAPGGQFLLSRAPFSTVDVRTLPGKQRRTLLLGDTELRGKPLTFATTHMESYLDDGPTRARQLAVIFQTLREKESAIVLGDLNFGEGEEPETSALDPRFVDVWTAVRASDPGFTWNNDENPLAAIGAFIGEPNRRLDRVLVASKDWRGAEASLLGNQSAGRRKLTQLDRAAIEMPTRPRTKDDPIIEVFPSDHYGLCVTLGPVER